ncbi:MAG TPA: uridine kinase [Polyangia bacterium]
MASKVVGIAGGSGSGKTTLAKGVAAAMPAGQVVVIPHDAYYRDLSHLPFADRIGCNFDEPSALDNERLVADLGALRAGQAIVRPNYDFATHTRLAETTPVASSRVVILEGILVLAIPALRELLDFKVFVEASESTRQARRIERDVAERGRTREGAATQFQRITQPMHDLHVEPSRGHADLVVSGERSTEAAVKMVSVATLRLLKPGIRA